MPGNAKCVGDGGYDTSAKRSKTRFVACPPDDIERILEAIAVEDEALLRFYEGKAVNADGVAGERAFAEAKVLLGSLDIAMKRAGTPPKGPTAPKTPVL